jgi:hypothetical protein
VVSDAEDLGHAVGVDQVVDVDSATHGSQTTSVIGSVRTLT